MFYLKYLAVQVILLVLISCQEPSTSESGDNGRPNILFIAVDDLKPSIGCYGDTLAITPHMDKLASAGITFTRNYCQQAVCAPSRASLLTGRYPDQLQVWDLQTLIREKNPGITTLPQYFRMNGYVTAATGKIFDPRSLEGSWEGPHDSLS
jgi:arylsulfatase A-like enzyme